MKSRDYWKGRMEALEDEQYRRSMDYYRDVQEQFSRAQKGIQADIERWYQRIADNNGISYAAAKKLLKGRELEEFHWTVEQYIKAGEENGLDQRWMKQLENASARYHIDWLEAMKLQLQQHAELLYGEFGSSMEGFLKTGCAEQYYRTAYEVSKGTGIGFDLACLDTRRIDMLMKNPWAQDGKAFSDRIWDNRAKLVTALHTELAQCIIRGEAPMKTVARLAKRMGVSKAQAGNLIMTEAAAIASASQRECFRELGVEKFEFDATLDGATCEICQDMDGRVFPMPQFEVGVTAPPVHPRCRCCTLPGFEDWEEFGIHVERAARDPETRETVYVDGSLKYGEWKKQISGLEKAGDVAGTKAVKEYRIVDANGGKAKLKERIRIEKIISELPDRVVDSLGSVTIKLNSKRGSGYMPGEKIIFYSENASRREVFHEIGHALEEILFDSGKVRRLKEKILHGLTKDDIIVKRAVDSLGNSASVYLLDSDRFIDGYQSRLYVDGIDEAILPDGSIDPDVLEEVISVAIERYFCFPKAMKKNFSEFYNFVEEALK